METQDIEKIFREQIKEYKNDFGFACFFGSLNQKKDLDLFIIPTKETKKGHFLKQLISFLEKTKDKLNKKSINLIITWHSTYQEEVKYLNNSKDSLVIHICSFPDIHPIIMPDYLQELQKTKSILTGNYKAINKMKKTDLDYYYNYLFDSNCLLSDYPKELEKEKVFSKVNYVYKHAIGKKKELSGSPKEQFFECCDFLDKTAKAISKTQP